MPDLKKAMDAVVYGIQAAECAGDKAGRSSVVLVKTEDLDNILELLKMQEQVKPRVIFTTSNGCTSADCPRCKKRINSWNNPFSCGYCGQAVKWNE